MAMEKVVRIFKSHAEAADHEFFAALTPTERLAILLELIGWDDPDAATIERSVRIRPLAES